MRCLELSGVYHIRYYPRYTCMWGLKAWQARDQSNWRFYQAVHGTSTFGRVEPFQRYCIVISVPLLDIFTLLISFNPDASLPRSLLSPQNHDPSYRFKSPAHIAPPSRIDHSVPLPLSFRTLDRRSWRTKKCGWISIEAIEHCNAFYEKASYSAVHAAHYHFTC